MKKKVHKFEFCVVGGGMAGLIAALAAARNGIKTALVHDRPVLGGNASSEIRMHICGAHGEDTRETGILEELLLENHYRNPYSNFSLWDSVLYGKASFQEDLELFLNCSVNSCETDGDRIKSVTGWQMPSETWHTIEAELFADCSGDGILAPLSGADFRIGREGRDEFSESIAPEKSDLKTMGQTCLFQAREFDQPRSFIPPEWAHKYRKPEDLRGRNIDMRNTNFWWMEVGGEDDSIHDSEKLRDELLKIAFGVWDYIKNYSPIKDDMANWDLDWMGFLPGKRESRRYLGEHILTQNDIESEGRFEDIVAYGGWTMDDHFPAGFYHPEAGTIFHPAPSPFGIPYRSLYSRNVKNLFCAGRNHSATHSAMSATRVMATTSLMGQAVGTAASIAVKNQTGPHSVCEKHLSELKNILMDSDCYLPWNTREISELSKNAVLSASSGDPEKLRNGIDRAIGKEKNCWTASMGDSVTYSFEKITKLGEARIVFDSDLNRNRLNMRHKYDKDAELWGVPETLVKSFTLEAKQKDGTWEIIHSEENNYQRLVKIPLNLETNSLKLTIKESNGKKECDIFAFDCK